MFSSSRPLIDRDRAPMKGLGLPEAPLCAEKFPQVCQRPGKIGMSRPRRPFANGEYGSVEPLGFRILAQLKMKRGQAVHLCQRLGMFRTQEIGRASCRERV